MELFSPEMTTHLADLGSRLRDAYRSNEPFPHIVIDDFLPVVPLEAALRDYPAPDALPWIRFNKERELKLAFNDVARMPASIREILSFMNSPPMLQFLEKLTGIGGLLPDPYLAGGGLHQIRPGGHLGVHIDFNKYERFGIDRRLNMLLYLNKDWPEEYGGHLQLWDADMKHCVKRVLPVFNRCVVFSTTEKSYHGHPDPLTCPEDRTRRSLATYYYTNGRPAAEVAPEHTTIFRARPGERTTLAARAGRVARQLSPPVLTNLVRRLRGR